MEERLIDLLDLFSSARLSSGERALDHTVLGVELGKRDRVAAPPRVLKARAQFCDLVSGHGRALKLRRSARLRQTEKSRRVLLGHPVNVLRGEASRAQRYE